MEVATNYREYTVSEYAYANGIPVDTVRSRIRNGKIETVEIIRDGRTVKGIRVPVSNQSSNGYSNSQQPLEAEIVNGDDDSYDEEIRSPETVISMFQQFGEIREQLGRYMERAEQAEARAAEYERERNDLKLLTDNQKIKEQQLSDREGYYTEQMKQLEAVNIQQAERIKQLEQLLIDKVTSEPQTQGLLAKLFGKK